MSSQASEDDISRMSYTDFVGYINQWNVLPGAYITLSKWATFSNLRKDSRILDIACTSGFSSRELAVITGCSGVGIDISQPSVDMAEYNRNTYAPHVGIKYIYADGYTFESRERFSHVIVGASLKFLSDPRIILERIVSTYLANDGYLLASPFYVIKSIPEALVQKARDVFGITITTEVYKDIMPLYSGFEILYEDRCDLFQETQGELEHYCRSTIDRACLIRGIRDPVIKDAMYDRLMKIKQTSNELRPYQMYSVLVLRYRSQIYPHRYTELF